MKDLTIWCTYHKDEQIEQFGLLEDNVMRLFKGNDTGIEGENINHLNPFYSEIVTLYYVWTVSYTHLTLPTKLEV